MPTAAGRLGFRLNGVEFATLWLNSITQTCCTTTWTVDNLLGAELRYTQTLCNLFVGGKNITQHLD